MNEKTKVKLPLPEIPRLEDALKGEVAQNYMPEIGVTTIYHAATRTGWIYTARLQLWHVVHPASGKVFAEHIRAVIRSQRDLNAKERDGAPIQ